MKNNLVLCTEGKKCKDLLLTSDNGTIIKPDESGNFIIEPKQVGEANISVKCKNKILRTIKFRVKNIPEPVVMLNQMTGGNILLNVLKKQIGLVAQIQNMDIDTHILITGFTLIILRDGKCQFTKEYSTQKFSDEVKVVFSSLQTKDKIIISNISYRGAATKGTLQPIEFNILIV